MTSQTTSQPPGEMIANDRNRSELQSIITLHLKQSYSEIKLSPTSNPQITISARQTWSKRPSEPLTLTTRFTPLDIEIPGRPWTGGQLESHLQYRKNGGEWRQKQRGAYHHNYKHPAGEDWQEELGFVTLPSLESGEEFAVTRDVDLSSLMGDTASDVKAGDTISLRLCDGEHRSTPGTEWWNWGDLEREFKGKKLGYVGDPMYNNKSREEEREKIPKDVVLGYENWRDVEDEEGNQMVWLELQFGDGAVDFEIK